MSPDLLLTGMGLWRFIANWKKLQGKRLDEFMYAMTPAFTKFTLNKFTEMTQ